ncbi:MAG: hypothetical protein ACUZ8O_01670, partial [Candidatus Anammoxibacter sp.]
MKNLLKGVCVVSVFVIALAFASQANATSIDFSGGTYSITDVIGGQGANGTGFAETISFTDSNVTSFSPLTDAVFSDIGIETVRLADLTLDGS